MWPFSKNKQAPAQEVPANLTEFLNAGYRDMWNFGGLYPQTTISGANVTDQTAFSITAVYCAINAISSMIAAMDLEIYKRLPTGGKKPDTNRPEYPLLHYTPDGHTTSMKYRQQQMVHVLSLGNSYSRIIRDGGGYVTGLDMLDPKRVKPRYATNGKLVYDVMASQGGVEYTLPAYQVLHLSGMGWDGVQGYSPITVFRETLGLAMSQEQYQSAFMGNNATPAGILDLGISDPGPEERKQMMDAWNSWHQGAANSKKTGMLYGGMKWIATGVSPEDAELLLSRTFSIQEVCRMFNIPPNKLFEFSRATFSNHEEANSDFYSTSLMVWCEAIEAECNLKLFTPQERGKWFVQHDMKKLLRGSSKDRADYHTKMFMVGAESVNDIREAEGYNPVEGGDKHYVPLNMSAVEDPVPEAPATDVPPPSLETAPEAPPDPESAENDTTDVVRSALKGVAVDAFGRMVRRETTAMERASKKEGFADWLTEFLPAHRSMVVESITPAIEAINTIRATPLDVASVADEYIAEGRKELDALLANGTGEMAQRVALLAEQWNKLRANDFVQRLMAG